MKKITSLLLILFAITTLASAQTTTTEKVTVEESDIAFELPEGWRNDPYSASSVCDCEGVIIDEVTREMRINIYPTNAAGMNDAKRDRIWGYTWDPASAKPFNYNSKGKTTYTGEIGHWIDNEDDHIVIRLEAHSKSQYARIFIFGKAADLEADKAVYELFLDTFVFQKRNKRG